MTLTQEQSAAIDGGRPVPLVVDGKRCVLIREDAFEEALRQEPSPRASYAAVLKAIDREDENTDQYLDYLSESG